VIASPCCASPPLNRNDGILEKFMHLHSFYKLFTTADVIERTFAYKKPKKRKNVLLLL
jgi:hypothetical protein